MLNGNGYGRKRRSFGTELNKNVTVFLAGTVWEVNRNETAIELR